MWAREATEYCIFGSYDDTCDAIFWGIADTRESRNAYKRYPGDESPDAYYNVVKDYLRTARSSGVRYGAGENERAEARPIAGPFRTGDTASHPKNDSRTFGFGCLIIPDRLICSFLQETKI